MRKTMMVWSACAAALLPALAAGTAMADGAPTVQGAGQSAGSTQAANSSATSNQSNPTNNAISVAILSPNASSGPVSQANNSAAQSAAGNTNATTQNAAQNAAAGAIQQAAQAASNAQAANSAATSNQSNASNNAIHVAILSPGASSGPVSQENNSNAHSQAGNANTTTQNASQSAGGGGGGGGGGSVQAAGQDAQSQQSANSSATSNQSNPTNNAISVAILSPGASTGPVSQQNNSAAQSAAGNTNATTQNAAQSGGGAVEAVAPDTSRSQCASCEPHPSPCGECGHSSNPTVQGIGQQAINDQTANSSATSNQTNPTNNAISVAILSPYASTGPVSQQNNSYADSKAGNTNATTQNAAQSAGGWGGAVQALGQFAYNKQAANSAATSNQYCPSNLALSLPILSPYASSGPVYQANNSGAQSQAGNANTTTQNAQQAFAGWSWAPLMAI
jgi:hypothetical protein